MTVRADGDTVVRAAGEEVPDGDDAPGNMRTTRSGTATRLLRGTSEWLIALGVGVLTAGVGVIPQWRGSFFYYVGDQHEQFAPLWHVFGWQLRNGHWPTMDPAGWMGGNYAAEALTGIWNPVNLANFVLVSYFDNLSLAAFTVMVEFLALLSMGVFLLAREYGSGRVAAVVVATAVPMSGFTLWYEASGWPAGLMAFTWVTWFWWAARRQSRGVASPLLPFLFGYLAMTTGSPYASLGLVVVLGALTVELAVHRRFGRIAHLVVTGACIGAVALLVYLPLLGTGDVTARQELAELVNDTFLVPDLGDLAAGSSVTYLPAMSNWNGALLETVPSTYFAWFVVPLLPWLRWDVLRRRRTTSTSVFVVAGFYLLATLGPSNLWLFRWPVRVIEYLYLAVAVLFAVVLSAGIATDHARQRAIVSGTLVAAGAYLAWAVRPDDYNAVHAGGLLLVAALTTLALVAHARGGMPALGLVVVIGTAGVVTLQSSVFPAKPASPAGPAGAQESADRAAAAPMYPAYDLARIAAGTGEYQGTVLQIAALNGVTTEQMRSGEILFGNLPRAAGLQSVASYTGMGFLEFGTELCMDYRGATCPEAFDRLWAPAGPDVPVPLVDAMRVSTLVLQRALLPDVVDRQPPAGWRAAVETPVRTVWIRERPLLGDGRVSWSSPGVDVRSDSAEPEREVIRYRATAPGRILLARLAWPGYTATVDGREVGVLDGPAGLLAVDVPAGEGTVVVEYSPPGLRLGMTALAAAGAIVVVHTAGWLWVRRRSGRRSRIGPEGIRRGVAGDGGPADEPGDPGTQPGVTVPDVRGPHLSGRVIGKTEKSLTD